MTPQEIEAFLKEPRIADLATVRPDGSPHVAPVWFHWDGETVKVMSEPASVKVRNIRHDSRVSLSIATNREPYRYVIVSGVAEVSDVWASGAPELLKTLAVHYKGAEAGVRYAEQVSKEMDFVIISIAPTKISGWSDAA